MGRAAAENGWPPRVLSTVYGNELRTFHDLLIDLLIEASCGGEGANGAELREQAEKRLIRPDDTADYVNLLRCSFAAMPETAPALGSVSLDQRWSQQEIVDRVIALKFRQEAKPSHVLCAGYRKLRPSSGDLSRRQAPQGLECDFESASLDVVTLYIWQALLSRIGHSIMLHVLSHPAVFIPLPNNCFLQILGNPIDTTLAAIRQSPSLRRPAPRMLAGLIRNDQNSEFGNAQKKPESGISPTPGCDDEKNGCSKEIFKVDPDFDSSENICASSRNHMPSMTGKDKQIRDSSLKIGSKKRCNEHCDSGRGSSRKKIKCQSLKKTMSQTVQGLKSKTTISAIELAAVSHTHPGSDVPARSAACKGRESLSNKKRGRPSQREDSTCHGKTDDEISPVTTRHNKKQTSTSADAEREESKSKNLPQNLETEGLSQTRQLSQYPAAKGNRTGSGSPHRPRKGNGKITASIRIPEEGCDPIQAISGSAHVEDASRSIKKGRLPSWKRKKLRRAQESGNDPATVGNSPHSGDSETHDLRNESEVHGCCSKKKSTADLSGHHRCCDEDAVRVTKPQLTPGKVNRNGQERRSHGTQNHFTTNSVPHVATGAGTRLKLIERAPLFYSCSYGRHPGLPAKLKLNQLINFCIRRFPTLGVVLLVACSIAIALCRMTFSHTVLSIHQYLSQLVKHSVADLAWPTLHKNQAEPEGRLVDTLDDKEHGAFQSTDLDPQVEEFMSLLLGSRKATIESDVAVHAPLDAEEKESLQYCRSACQTRNFSCHEQAAGLNTCATKSKKKRRCKKNNGCDSDNQNLDKAQQADVTSSYISHSKVVGFLWAVCRSIIPGEMLGCVKSWRTLRRSIFYFVSLRKHEKFNVQQVLFELKVSAFPWLNFKCNCHSVARSPDHPSRSKAEERNLQQKRLELWLYWLFSSFLVPLIRAHFYVTENENYRQNIFYYRKPVWARIQSDGLKELTTKKYKKLSRQTVSQALKVRQLGFSQIRLMPKRIGFRPLAHLSASSRGTLKFWTRSNVQTGLRQESGTITKELSLESGKDLANCQIAGPKSRNFLFRPVNFVLRDVYSCLKLEKECHVDNFGSSVFDYSDIHSKLLPFSLQLKESSTGMPRLFMTVCDIARAFETIPQKKLQHIVEGLLRSSRYDVSRYIRVTPTLYLPEVSHGRACARADVPHKFVDMVNSLAVKHAHSIFTDQAFCTSLTRENIVALLDEHLKQNIVQIGANFYQQKVGIPQGSILSSLLCSLFYGHFDIYWLFPILQSIVPEETTQKHVLGSKPSLARKSSGKKSIEPEGSNSNPNPLKQIRQGVDDTKPFHSPTQDGGGVSGMDGQDFILLRMIDDSLFISTSERKARAFVEIMHMGSVEYGCQANERKTATSFHLQRDNIASLKNVYKTDDGACFIRWSGLLINCYTMELQADYTRYCGEHIRSTLTVRRERNQGVHLVLSLCQYMRPKCHPLFFDSRINSSSTIQLNVFQAFLLCAMKFHASICSLPKVAGSSNQPFWYEAISYTIRFMYGLLQQKVKVLHRAGPFTWACLAGKQVHWLGLTAFHRVLQRKQARYPTVLRMLQAQLQSSQYDSFTRSPDLSAATDMRRSSMFRSIKY